MKTETKKNAKRICKEAFKFGAGIVAITCAAGAGIAAGTFVGGLVDNYFSVEVFDNDKFNYLAKKFVAIGTAETVTIITMDKSAKAFAGAFGVEL